MYSQICANAGAIGMSAGNSLRLPHTSGGRNGFWNCGLNRKFSLISCMKFKFVASCGRTNPENAEYGPPIVTSSRVRVSVSCDNPGTTGGPLSVTVNCLGSSFNDTECWVLLSNMITIFPIALFTLDNNKNRPIALHQ